MKAFKLKNKRKVVSGFNTPEKYFANFSEKAIQQLLEKDTNMIYFFKNNKRIFLAIAAILILALFVPFFNTRNNNVSTDVIDTSVLENYLSYESNINQYDLINDLEYNDIDNIKTTVALEDATIEEILVSNTNLEHLICE